MSKRAAELRFRRPFSVHTDSVEADRPLRDLVRRDRDPAAELAGKIHHTSHDPAAQLAVDLRIVLLEELPQLLLFPEVFLNARAQAQDRRDSP